ncbi:sporulation protein [Dactylosporangium vinaceum]|uniref:Sporulation protein n=1 Tax=Dactylosporangium vinaceum TaxID=53362 RepID=A0ABV5MFX5_9ACTN|nr:sporulation protein [Dactylosporangium vinaceum]UAB98898.1 sporulation protein [Dactylosporangium vinaceum]
MVFRSLRRAALGVGGPAVDTVLANPESFPNASISGVVRLTGGERGVEIERIVLTLVTRDGVAARELGRQELAGEFRLEAGATREIPLVLHVPLETPITHVYGERVPGLAVGVRTDLQVAFAHDPGDMDFLAVHPLPAEAAALDALRTLGFRLNSADVSQVFEFWVAPQYQDIATEVAVGFTTGADFVALHVNQTVGTRYNRDETVDWAAEVDALMRHIGQIRR